MKKLVVSLLGGAVLALRVWDVGDGVVYLASETEFQKGQAGRQALEPIGFPIADVFRLR